jgi:ribonucleotide reductase alpha subunit
MLYEVLSFFEQKGINLTSFPITFDSWYGSKKLVNMLREVGFTSILIHAKGNYVFEIDGKKQKLSVYKKQVKFGKSAWGCGDIPVVRKAAESPTFGKLILLFFKDGQNVKCIMVFGKKLRASKIISIWRQHHSVECFWRRLKTDIQIHRVRMRSREGVYAMIGIKIVAYLLMEQLSFRTGLTFQQLKVRAKREIDIYSFFSEHFHSLMAA